MAQINVPQYFFEKSSTGVDVFKMIIRGSLPVVEITADVFAAFGLDSSTSALTIWNTDFVFTGVHWTKASGETHFTPVASPAEWTDTNIFEEVFTELGDAITEGMTETKATYDAQSVIDEDTADGYTYLIGD